MSACCTVNGCNDGNLVSPSDIMCHKCGDGTCQTTVHHTDTARSVGCSEQCFVSRKTKIYLIYKIATEL